MWPFRSRPDKPVPRGRWRTKAGKLIWIRDMDSLHLANAIALLERANRTYVAAHLPCLYAGLDCVHGDGATMCLEGTIGDAEEALNEGRGPWDSKIEELRHELAARSQKGR